MSQPVNLNRYKKKKARAEDKARADQNAVLHGLPKATRELAKARAERAKLDLDGKSRLSKLEKHTAD